MFKVSRKAVPALLVLAALIVGAWTSVGPTVGATFQTTPGPDLTQMPTVLPTQSGGTGTAQLHSWLASEPEVQRVVDQLNAYKVNPRSFNRFTASRYDRLYLQDAITGNTLELQMMQYALPKVTNPDLADLIQFMIDQHTKELNDTMAIAKRVGVKTTVDLSNAGVFPGTPLYDLGVRTEDLIHEYMDPLTSYTGTSFDQVALNMIHSFHVEDVQSELAAERLSRGGRMLSFIRHGADVTELHIKLMEAVEQRDFLGLPGEVSFEKYQGNQGGGTGTPVPSVVPSLEPSVMPTSEGTVMP